jgi:hypothetical protein
LQLKKEKWQFSDGELHTKQNTFTKESQFSDWWVAAQKKTQFSGGVGVGSIP